MSLSHASELTSGGGGDLVWVTLEEMRMHLGGVRRSGRGEHDVVGCVLPGWAVDAVSASPHPTPLAPGGAAGIPYVLYSGLTRAPPGFCRVGSVIGSCSRLKMPAGP